MLKKKKCFLLKTRLKICAYYSIRDNESKQSKVKVCLLFSVKWIVKRYYYMVYNFLYVIIILLNKNVIFFIEINIFIIYFFCLSDTFLIVFGLLYPCKVYLTK
jgi:hypothetical protein